MFKKCYACKQELPIEAFNKNRAKPDGRATECKVCKAEKDKLYRAKNLNKIKAIKHQYYLGNKEVIIARVSEYIGKNRGKHNAWGTRAKNKLKHEVFSHYSEGDPICKHCGIMDLDLLSIDHIKGGGNQHRKEIGLGGKGGYPVYQWVKRNNYPDYFQVLCMNCQYRKRYLEMKPENPTHAQEVQARYTRSIKVECFEHYGGLKCPCGEEDIEVLTLDHVNDDGAVHRQETGLKGYNFYHWLRRNNFLNDPQLQVLCLNCNYKKR